MSETGYIFFYVTLFGLVGLIGGLSTGTTGLELSEDITSFPEYTGGILDALAFPFEVAIYFISLQGLTIFGIGAIFSAFISLIFNVPMIYVIARLVRGGG